METGKSLYPSVYVQLELPMKAKQMDPALNAKSPDGAAVVVELPAPLLCNQSVRWLAVGIGMFVVGLALVATVLSLVPRGGGAGELLGRLEPTLEDPVPPVAVPRSRAVARDLTGRVYRLHVLSNGLTVFLCSDPTAETAGASMAVGTGGERDPRDRQGLAHLLEHMLFQGSEKYPSATEYKTFLANSGGSGSALTDDQFARYLFTVPPDSLDAVLDRWSQFFIAPTLNYTSIVSSIEAVNNEFLLKLQRDSRRMMVLQRYLAAEDSAYHHFNTGNTQTLSHPDIRDRLVKFYSTYYKAPEMRLALLGSQSLEVLQGYAETYFNAVPTGSTTTTTTTTTTTSPSMAVPVGSWDEPFPPNLTGRWITVQTVSDVRQVTFRFTIKPLQARYRAQVGELLSYLMNTKYHKSLYSVLKALGLISSLSVSTEHLSYVTFFGVTVSLTEAGLSNIAEIGQQLFEFVSLLRESPEQCRSSWEQMVALSNLTFTFQSTPSTSDFVGNTAQAMLVTTDIEDLLGNPKNFAYNATLVAEVLLEINPRNMLLYLQIKKPNISLPLTEPFYDIKFQNQPIPTELLEAWASAKPSSQMAFPSANQYIPTNFTVLPLQPNGTSPVELLSGSEVPLWYGRSAQFAQPKAYFECVLDTAEVSRNATSYAIADLFSLAVTDALEETTALASLVGLDYDFSTTSTGFQMSVSGYSDTLQELLATVLETVTGCTSGGVPVPSLTAARLSVLVDTYRRGLNNSDSASPATELPDYYTKQLTRTPTYTRKELRAAAVQPLTVAQLQSFARDTVYPVSRVECLAFGNLSPEEAMAMSQAVARGLGYRAAKAPAEPEELGAVVLPENSTAFTIPAPNSGEANSGLLGTFQLAPVIPARELTGKKAATLHLLQSVLQQPCYNRLRTEEQLGYKASCSHKAVRSRTYSTSYLHVLVVSGNYTAAYLDSRAMNFFKDYVTELVAMSDEEFETSRSSLVKTTRNKPNTLASEAFGIWTEITQHTYSFNISEAMAQTLQSVTKAEIQEMLQEAVLSSARRRVSLWYIGGGKPVPTSPEPNQIDPPQVILPITALEVWKAAQPSL